MHEVILTRGDVMGLPPEQQVLIFDKRNCVLVHNNMCHIIAATQAGQIVCVYQIAHYEGKEEVMRWLEGLGEVVGDLPRSVMSAAYNLVEEAKNST